jgi:hypothetical protein
MAYSYLEIDRDERFILVRINLAKGRTTDGHTCRSRIGVVRSLQPAALRSIGAAADVNKSPGV